MAGFENDVVFAKNADFSELDNQAPVEANGLVTDGDLWIGSTLANAGGTHINVGTITSTGGSITVSYDTPNINIEVASSGITAVDATSGSAATTSLGVVTIKSPPFSQVGSSATSVLNSGEFVTAAVTRTLPASAGLADGDLFIFACTTAADLVIQAVGAQQIVVGSAVSAAAGTATSTALGDSLTLRFNATDGFFYAVSVTGNWLVV